MAIQYPVPQLTPEELLYLRDKDLSVASATLVSAIYTTAGFRDRLYSRVQRTTAGPSF